MFGEVNIAPFAVYLNKDEFNYVKPDISVICDLDKNKVTVYNFEKDRMDEYSFEDQVPAGIYEGFSMSVQ